MYSLLLHRCTTEKLFTNAYEKLNLIETASRKMALWESAVESIKEYLIDFPGGSIDLKKTSNDGVAYLGLNRPEKCNAMSGEMMVALRDCVKQLESWDEGKAVILYGNGKAFCSGGDLDFARKSGLDKRGHEMALWMNDTLTRFKNLPIVSVCLLHGPALGGGAEIVTACDYVVATESAKLGFVQGKLGIITAWGGATRLTSKIGQRKALDLLLTSKILNAKDCLEIGLVDEIITAEDNLECAKEICKIWLQTKIGHDRSIIRAYKEIVVHATKTADNAAASKFELVKFAPFWGGDLNISALDKKIKHRENDQHC